MAETVKVTPGAIRALAARYKFQTDRMNEAAKDGNEKVMHMAMKSLTQIEEECVKLGVDFESLGTVDTSGAVVTNNKITPTNDTPAPAGSAVATKGGVFGGTKPKSVAQAEKVAARAAAIAAEKAGQGKVPGQARTKKEKKPAKMRPCLDGCGTEVPGNFKMGHDAKLKSLILKVERGEEDKANIPDIAQDLIKFKKGEMVENKDSKGKTLSKTQEWICTAAPVKFPGRPEIQFTVRED